MRTDYGCWSLRPLGEVADVVSGYAFASSDFGEIGVPVIKIKNVRVGYIDITEADCVHPKFLDIPKRYHVSAGDILISLTGSHISQPNSAVGRVARHSASLPDCLLNQRVGKVIIKDPDACDLEFLYYALSRREIMRSIAMKAHGAANQANVSPTQVESIQIPLPPLMVQRRVAGILSNYTELIEANLRRIALLEEMARRLFEEWFVRFRFPAYVGHEMDDTPEGKIPKGWSIGQLSQVLTTLESGSRPKGGIKEGDGQVPSIGAENINGLGKYDFGKEKLVPRVFFAQMRRGIVRSGDVLLYKDGAHIGRKAMFRDDFPHAECAVNEHVLILRPLLPVTPAFLYFWLDQPIMTSKIKGLNSNAAQPGINQSGVSSLPILQPPAPLLARYSETVEPILALLFRAAKMNRELSLSRDLILPRLISGQLSLSTAEHNIKAVA